uniref:Photosystem II 12 kDa extrinsic protein n=1 Tax=Rhizochromulina marina TaxID=1034831 RepID=A0A7S2SQF2_9STRA|mmetsp:Transcript_4198/g.12417  ORF Transcript_4198/g.12417 Transcript_4198/m.12417 type:complete len:157 (+) Transcript_4198:52-522(+)|eukprot:CAMPEP_0118968212 /NCGR_PEP_ID=MMETSP1173-20130426/5468_1 /TAXON_ID=1034831 /ORGANISM="Rhizochromulina marina cf, Strain CCMP1243" /LENGTH=156 /DNA_ID=CAMNT_0006917293 /DNA_START=233 /DNA_END=703 /DNA_ORIENTATION=+
MRAFFAAILAIALGVAVAFTPSARMARTRVVMSAEAEGRRNFLAKTAAAAAALAPLAANADIDYEGIKYLGGGDQIDLNNANVRAYLRLPGMYPTIAGKIVSNKSPLTKVGDVYNINTLTDKEKSVIKTFESKGKFVVLEPKAEYVIDKFNNGLYR